MKFSQLHKTIAYFIAGLGLLALSLGATLSATSLAIIFAGYALSVFAEGAFIQKESYARIWTAAIIGLFVIDVARVARGTDAFPLGLEFAAALQISRLFSRRSSVEYQQIAALAFLHLIAGTVLSTDISYAFLFLGFVIATPWMLTLSHLRREIEGPKDPSAASTPTDARVARLLGSRKIIGADFLLGTALLVIPIFIMTGALFLLFPRIGLGFLSMGHGRGQRVAGFSDHIELGGFGVIRDDATVVLRITDINPAHAVGTDRQFRIRGMVFDHYDGRGWSRSQLPMRRLRSMDDAYPLLRIPSARDTKVHIVLEQLEQPIVFLPENTVAIEIPASGPGALARSRALGIKPGVEVRYLDSDDRGLTYNAFISDEAEVLPRDEMPEHFLQIPDGHEDVTELAKRVVGDATSPRAKAQRILAFLRSSGQFQYTLALHEVGTRGPLHSFLFETKAGHCEYFATAMTIMLRAVGVPARNVTGFLGGRYNSYGGYYAIRQGDAHSWVEALTDNDGWETYEPTPAGRDAFGPGRGLLATLRELSDAVSAKWDESVIGYNLASQVNFFRRMGKTWRNLRGETHSSANVNEPAKKRGASLRDLKNIGAWLLGAIALIGIAFLIRERSRAQKERAQGAAKLSRSAESVRVLYEELDRVLARSGKPRPASRTPNEHAAALEREGFAAANTVRAITTAYVNGRYGNAFYSDAAIADLRRALRAIPDDLRENNANR